MFQFTQFTESPSEISAAGSNKPPPGVEGLTTSPDPHSSQLSLAWQSWQLEKELFPAGTCVCLARTQPALLDRGSIPDDEALALAVGGTADHWVARAHSDHDRDPTESGVG